MPVEDDLGYYPNGNKRTLTDDQIAMFRHSEIYAILRERQVRKENREADGEYGLENTLPFEHDSDARLQARSDVDHDGATLTNKENDRAPLYNTEQVLDDVTDKPSEQHDYSHNPNDSRSITLADETRREEVLVPKGKRKRHVRDTGDVPDKGYTSRRLARELDSVVSTDQILDYGDEPTEKDTSTQRRPEHLCTGSTLRQGEETDSLQGKKIWWPVIEGT